MGKIKPQKTVRNLLDKLRKLYMNGTVIQKVLAFSSFRKFQAIFASPNRYFTGNSRWVPLSLMVPLISTQVAYLILTLRPYDMTHLFFRFKITCALTYVAKNASVEINLKLILTQKEKVVDFSREFFFLFSCFQIIEYPASDLGTRIGFKFRNWKITALWQNNGRVDVTEWFINKGESV